MKINKHFHLEEFVPPIIFSQFGAKSAWFVNPKLFVLADLLRDMTGQSVKINDWFYGGKFINSGYRTPGAAVGAKYSMHRLGLAIDVKVKNMTPKQVLEIIFDNAKAFKAAGLTTIEDTAYTPTWLHLDCRPRIDGHPEPFLIVKP